MCKLALQNLKFGTEFSDHVLHVEHAVGQGWGTPKIVPFGFIPVHPAAQVFHYGMSAFEGLEPQKLTRSCSEPKICIHFAANHPAAA